MRLFVSAGVSVPKEFVAENVLTTNPDHVQNDGIW